MFNENILTTSRLSSAVTMLCLTTVVMDTRLKLVLANLLSVVAKCLALMP